MVVSLIYRSRYYQFEEYLGQWYERLKNEETTTMTVKIMAEIEKYKVLTKVICGILHVV